MADWLTGQPGVRTLTAEVEVGNEASRRLLERLGFSLLGTRDRMWLFERPTPPR